MLAEILTKRRRAARGTNVSSAECLSRPLQAEAMPVLGAEDAPESGHGLGRERASMGWGSGAAESTRTSEAPSMMPR